MKNMRSCSKYAVLPLAIFLLGSLLTWAQAATSGAECRASILNSTCKACCQPTRESVRFRPTAAVATIHPSKSHPESLERYYVTCGNELC